MTALKNISFFWFKVKDVLRNSLFTCQGICINFSFVARYLLLSRLCYLPNSYRFYTRKTLFKCFTSGALYEYKLIYSGYIMPQKYWCQIVIPITYIYIILEVAKLLCQLTYNHDVKSTTRKTFDNNHHNYDIYVCFSFIKQLLTFLWLKGSTIALSLGRAKCCTKWCLEEGVNNWLS